MKHATTCSLALLLTTACAPDARPEGTGLDDQAARSNKVEICHVSQGTGDWSLIEISENAVDAHIDNHGDWLVQDELCGDGVDNNCDGDIDEDCCPLWDDFGGLPEAGEFDGYEYGYAYAADSDPDNAWSYTDVYFYGWGTDGSELRFSVDMWDLGAWYAPTDGYQETEWTWTDAGGTTSSDSYDGEISADEYATCTDEAFAWADSRATLYSWDYRDGI